MVSTNIFDDKELPRNISAHISALYMLARAANEYIVDSSVNCQWFMSSALALRPSVKWSASQSVREKALDFAIAVTRRL